MGGHRFAARRLWLSLALPCVPIPSSELNEAMDRTKTSPDHTGAAGSIADKHAHLQSISAYVRLCYDVTASSRNWLAIADISRQCSGCTAVWRP